MQTRAEKVRADSSVWSDVMLMSNCTHMFSATRGQKQRISLANTETSHLHNKEICILVHIAQGICEIAQGIYEICITPVVALVLVNVLKLVKMSSACSFLSQVFLFAETNISVNIPLYLSHAPFIHIIFIHKSCQKNISELKVSVSF